MDQQPDATPGFRPACPPRRPANIEKRIHFPQGLATRALRIPLPRQKVGTRNGRLALSQSGGRGTDERHPSQSERTPRALRLPERGLPCQSLAAKDIGCASPLPAPPTNDRCSSAATSEARRRPLRAVAHPPGQPKGPRLLGPRAGRCPASLRRWEREPTTAPRCHRDAGRAARRLLRGSPPGHLGPRLAKRAQPRPPARRPIGTCGEAAAPHPRSWRERSPAPAS